MDKEIPPTLPEGQVSISQEEAQSLIESGLSQDGDPTSQESEE